MTNKFSTSEFIGFAIVAVFVAVSLLAPLIARYSPYAQHAGLELVRPSPQFFLGTDELGRDIWSRMLFAIRISLMIALGAIAFGAGFGVTLGMIAGYFGGWTDAIISRSMDTLLAFPAILLGIATAMILGPGILTAAVAVGIVSIPQFGRLSRAGVIAENAKDYVIAARASGCADARIIVRHILPNVLTPVIVQVTVALAYAVLLEAGLSFLGLGVPPPEPSLGAMLNTSRDYLHNAPWYGFFPGIALSLLLFGLNSASESVRSTLTFVHQVRARSAPT